MDMAENQNVEAEQRSEKSPTQACAPRTAAGQQARNFSNRASTSGTVDTGKDTNASSDPSVHVNSLLTASLDIQLRGVYAGECVRLFAGAEGDFSKSIACNTLHAFLSHSWRGNKWQKCVATVVYAYWMYALMAAVLACIVFSVCFVYSGRQVYCFSDLVSNNRRFCHAHGNVYAGSLTLLMVLAGHRLVPLRCARMFFIDKGCINQATGKSIAAGVQSLGGILRCCSRLVILWSDDYFERLWCIFELACFSRFGGIQNYLDLVLVPTILPTLVIIGNLFLLSVWILFDVSLYYGILDWMVTNLSHTVALVIMAMAVATPFFGALFFTISQLTRLREHLVKEIAEFKTETAKITKESERNKIEECIRLWYGDIQTFDEFVNTDVLHEMERQLGQRMYVPYWSMVCMSFPTILRALDALLSGSWHGFLVCFGYAFIINPTFSLVTQACLQQRCIPKFAACILSWCAIVLLWAGWAGMVMLAPDSIVMTVFLTSWSLVLCAYSPRFAELHQFGYHSRWCHKPQVAELSQQVNRRISESSGTTAVSRASRPCPNNLDDSGELSDAEPTSGSDERHTHDGGDANVFINVKVSL
eukprot:TRINITY_DN73982_c0_g1_i1.p1 TRINITY_DN73982_c0_g1~~TRINITY_DN73982_c0_g1_i1.p1  ORF type:complete len:589 (-),score=58.64 TRINITY_DN73982_c0_g1_i1:147-1913(-)